MKLRFSQQYAVSGLKNNEYLPEGYTWKVLYLSLISNFSKVIDDAYTSGNSMLLILFPEELDGLMFQSLDDDNIELFTILYSKLDLDEDDIFDVYQYAFENNHHSVEVLKVIMSKGYKEYNNFLVSAVIENRLDVVEYLLTDLNIVVDDINIVEEIYFNTLQHYLESYDRSMLNLLLQYIKPTSKILTNIQETEEQVVADKEEDRLRIEYEKSDEYRLEQERKALEKKQVKEYTESKQYDEGLIYAVSINNEIYVDQFLRKKMKDVKSFDLAMEITTDAEIKQSILEAKMNYIKSKYEQRLFDIKEHKSAKSFFASTNRYKYRDLKSKERRQNLEDDWIKLPDDEKKKYIVLKEEDKVRYANKLVNLRNEISEKYGNDAFKPIQKKIVRLLGKIE